MCCVFRVLQVGLIKRQKEGTTVVFIVFNTLSCFTYNENESQGNNTAQRSDGVERSTWALASRGRGPTPGWLQAAGTTSHAGDAALSPKTPGVATAAFLSLALCCFANLSAVCLSVTSEQIAGFGGGVCAQYEVYIFTKPSRVSIPNCLFPV